MKDKVFYRILCLISILALASPWAGVQGAEAADFVCADVTEIPQTECEALVAIYNSLNGPAWATPAPWGEEPSNWFTTSTPSEWTGLSVSEGHVVGIGPLINMAGTLPPVLADLPFLETLELSGNGGIGGSFPLELTSLTHLKNLGLCVNLEGEIPPEIGSMSSLESLAICGGQITGSIPPELGNLTNLQILDLSFNRLQGNIPPELGNLTNLQNLWLNNNQLSGSIPEELINLTNLSGLNLSNNQLTVPEDYPNPDNPFHLFLYAKDNSWHMSQAPVLPNLKEWTGEQVISKFTCGEGEHQFIDLEVAEDIPFSELKVGVTAAHDFIASLNLWLVGPDGQRVQLFGNFSEPHWNMDVLFENGGGTPSPWDGHDTGPAYYEKRWQPLEPLAGFGGSKGTWRLEFCDLGLDGIEGPVPDGMIYRFALSFEYKPVKPTTFTFNWFDTKPQTLHVAPAAADGEWTVTPNQPWLSVSPASGSGAADVLVSVDRTGLEDGVYDGSITVLMNGTSYEVPVKLKVAADFCSLVTEVPYEECQALVAIYNTNGGAGWLNSTFWMETEKISLWNGVYIVDGTIQRLFMSGFGLSGELAPAIGKLSSLDFLDLINNYLTGLPPEIGDMSSLRVLFLNLNQLSSLPPAIANLGNLRYLYLANNQLSALPPEIGNLSSLRVLEADFNQLSGPIPPALGNLTNLEALRLSDNQLSGPIPPELGNLVNLTDLVLYNNQLSGEIPDSLGNLTNLGGLFLNNNQLSGPIPAWIGNLTSLWNLQLNDNQFSGSIPPELGNLGGLGILELGNNRLTGDIPDSLVNLMGLWWGVGLYNNSLHVPHDYPNLENPLHMFLEERANGWHLNQIPLADFTVSEKEIRPRSAVQFTDTSMGTYDTCAWDFGDGTTSNECSPSHEYDKKGEYSVTLTLSGVMGEDTLFMKNLIEVKPGYKSSSDWGAILFLPIARR